MTNRKSESQKRRCRFAKGVPTVVINPLLIANFAKLSLSKTKTDKKDAMTITQFLLVPRESISQLSLSQDLQDFRDIARGRESVGNMIVAHKVEIKKDSSEGIP